MLNDNLESQLSAEYHLIFDDDRANECTVGKYGEIISGATPSTANDEFFCDEGIVWLTPKDLTSTGLKFITKGEVDITSEAYNSCSTKLLPVGTVLLTSRAPVGTVAIADKELCTNQGFKSIVPHPNYGSEFVYQFLKENKALLDSHASGTTFMEISGNVLKSVPAFEPKAENITKYKLFCEPIYNQQRCNEKEIKLLNSMLETLLCQLSSR
ncbi:MAG: restriction endonuclease subunit S [Lachnospiraceae bacterium]|nr:restriction endonuclease subunit S [Lachnospiraceae bacterium]